MHRAPVNHHEAARTSPTHEGRRPLWPAARRSLITANAASAHARASIPLTSREHPARTRNRSVGSAVDSSAADAGDVVNRFLEEPLMRMLSLQPFIPGGKDFAKNRALFGSLGFTEVWSGDGYVGF